MKPGMPLILGSVSVLGLLWLWQLNQAHDLKRELALISSKQVPVVSRTPNQEAAISNGTRELAQQKEIQRLRAEIERLQVSVAARKRATHHPVADSKENQASMTNGSLAVSEWKNQGQATPTGALETSLWAAAGGDLQTLAHTLYLEPQAREKAVQLFASLPAEQRAGFNSTEDFIALLMTPDIPLGQASLHPITRQYPANYTEVTISLNDEGNHYRTAVIGLVRTANDEWRLLVPEEAIEKYAARLTLAKTTP